MNSIWRNSFVGMALLVLILVLSGCAPNANASIISPELGNVEATATNQPLVGVVEDVVVEALPTLADLSTEEVRAGLPPEIAAAMDTVDIANGPNLALANACSGCHSMDASIQLAGPTWSGLGNLAIEHAINAGSDGPAAYLYESISAPNAYIVEGYQANIMPQTYLDSLSTEDFATLIDYILAQTQE